MRSEILIVGGTLLASLACAPHRPFSIETGGASGGAIGSGGTMLGAGGNTRRTGTGGGAGGGAGGVTAGVGGAPMDGATDRAAIDVAIDKASTDTGRDATFETVSVDAPVEGHDGSTDACPIDPCGSGTACTVGTVRDCHGQPVICGCPAGMVCCIPHVCPGDPPEDVGTCRVTCLRVTCPPDQLP